MGANEHDIVYDPIYDNWGCALTAQNDGGWIEIMAPDGQRVRRQVDQLTPAPDGTAAIEPEGGRDCAGCGGVATFDAVSKRGTWGYWCLNCFVVRTHGMLGTGLGQRLIPAPPPYLCHAIAEDEDEFGSVCAVCGGNTERERPTGGRNVTDKITGGRTPGEGRDPSAGGGNRSAGAGDPSSPPRLAVVLGHEMRWEGELAGNGRRWRCERCTLLVNQRGAGGDLLYGGAVEYVCPHADRPVRYRVRSPRGYCDNGSQITVTPTRDLVTVGGALADPCPACCGCPISVYREGGRRGEGLWRWTQHYRREPIDEDEEGNR